MTDETPTREELDRMNRRLARDLASLTAQKLKLSLWLAQILQAAGGRVVITGPLNDLGAVHLQTEHRCQGIGHGPMCQQLLALHAGLIGDCQDPACLRLAGRPEDEPGIRTEQRTDPASTETPAAKTSPADHARLMAAEAWQHPERN